MVSTSVPYLNLVVLLITLWCVCVCVRVLIFRILHNFFVENHVFCIGEHRLKYLEFRLLNKHIFFVYKVVLTSQELFSVEIVLAMFVFSRS